MQIRAWKDPEDPTYLVQVGSYMYEMDSRANLPNGVCSLVGTATDLAWTVRARPVNELPMGIVIKIAEIVRNQKKIHF